MKKKKKHIFGKICLFMVLAAVVGISSLLAIFFVSTKDVRLDVSALKSASEGANIEVFYADGEKIDTSKYFSLGERVSAAELKEETKNAFIATEDKRFYSHAGIDIKRILSAIAKNMKKGKFSEGASTISQQLIKNTHLSREKTLKRKLKEIRLAMELEKKFSKDEILEMYLSSIYFGNGCYGLSKAASFYFDKEPKDLSLGESALLAAVINAPSLYDPLSKSESAEKRKKLVLKNMLKLGMINEDDYQKNANSPEKIVKSASKSSFAQIKPILSEVSKRLQINESKLKNSSFKIYTSIKKDLSDSLEESLKSVADDNILGSNMAMIVVDNASKKIVAMSSNMKANMLYSYRQPGSTIKPILVYAPAIEYGLIYPESIIVDEPININGYAPMNASKSFSGKVSVRYAIEKSLNIPAVKTLSNLSVGRAKDFASRLGIEFSDMDNNLALALGGMTNGVTIKELADAYSTFATGGEFAKSSLIDRVEDENGRVIYRGSQERSRVMSEETSYLMSDMLMSVARSGTAKRLNTLSIPICAKTGTVGKGGKGENSDAFCVAYTLDYTVAAWIGENEKPLSSSVNGSNYPTEMIKNFYSRVPRSKDFVMPKGVVLRDIDTRSLEENKVELASPFTPARFKKQGLFSEKNLPETSTRPSVMPAILSVEMEFGEKPTLSFLSQTDQTYCLVREDLTNGEKIRLAELVGTGEKISYNDESSLSGVLYEYTLLTAHSLSPESEVFDEQTSVVQLMSF